MYGGQSPICVLEAVSHGGHRPLVNARQADQGAPWTDLALPPQRRVHEYIPSPALI